MVAEPVAAYEEAWSQLQEPVRPSQEPPLPLLRLLAALDTGWQMTAAGFASDMREDRSGDTLEAG